MKKLLILTLFISQSLLAMAVVAESKNIADLKTPTTEELALISVRSVMPAKQITRLPNNNPKLKKSLGFY